MAKLKSKIGALIFLTSLFTSVLFQSAQAAQTESARDASPIDVTGYWVSVVTEDWKFRMVTPDAGIFDGLTLSAEGRRVGNTWDPASDEASGRQCLGYGAPALMRLPGRFQITWEDANTLRIDSDYGTQSRLLHFDNAAPGAASLQGYSKAEWLMAPRGSGGSLKVVTTNLSGGYIRKNGAPYSSETTLTEYIDLHEMPNGDMWINITTHVDDPIYFSRPLIVTTDLKQLPNRRGWDPTECSAVL
ncbi:MAG: hypothetical protein P8M72_06950 [Gammaproteobacteria bacterium]|nr:hypothetical protein [Gammaproteobacteria bacterium]